MSATQSLYDRLGGQDALDRLAQRFYQLMRQMPEAAVVHSMHLMTIEEVEERLRHFLSGFFGGPDKYRSRYGEPMMRRRHLPFAIGPAERDAWMICMRSAMDDVFGNTPLRKEAEAQIAIFAEHMRNREANDVARGAGGGIPASGPPSMPVFLKPQP